MKQLLYFFILILLTSCLKKTNKNSYLIDTNDSINLYAFIGEKIAIEEFERTNVQTETFIGLDGDTIIQETIYLDDRYKAIYKVKENIFNKIDEDTITFLVYSHSQRPIFEHLNHALLYVSYDEKDSVFYHQKYQYDSVSLNKNNIWVGNKGQSLDSLFKIKKSGVFKARGIFK